MRVFVVNIVVNFVDNVDDNVDDEVGLRVDPRLVEWTDRGQQAYDRELHAWLFPPHGPVSDC